MLLFSGSSEMVDIREYAGGSVNRAIVRWAGFLVMAGMLFFGVIPAKAQTAETAMVQCDEGCVDASGMFGAVTMVLVVVAMFATWLQQKPDAHEAKSHMKLVEGGGDKNQERAA